MPTNEEKVQSTKTSLLSGNLIALAWMLLGTVGCYLINPLYGYGFLIFSTIAVYAIIRRMMCNSCYYCKSCTKGLAKLSILMRGGNNIPGLSKSSIVGMTVFAYVALAVIPSGLIVGSLLNGFDILKLVALSGLAVISVYGIAMHLKNGSKLITK
ncbi:MAG TPA: hypothetical protein VLH35_00725 [Candidatus Acidoferrales bacterium]|nr:hypothetical protein [Candidatus Acidoferrales bacterium]